MALENQVKLYRGFKGILLPIIPAVLGPSYGESDATSCDSHSLGNPTFIFPKA